MRAGARLHVGNSQLVTTQYDFLRSVVRSADHSLHLPDTAKK